MARHYGAISFLLFLLMILAGCRWTQGAFQNMAGNAGSAFAAASVTLRYAHEGKITSAYAASSFVNYRSQLDGLDQQLSSQSGAPNQQTRHHLLTLYKLAMQVVNHPCLDTTCHWHTQVMTLDRASQAFLEAGSA